MNFLRRQEPASKPDLQPDTAEQKRQEISAELAEILQERREACEGISVIASLLLEGKNDGEHPEDTKARVADYLGDLTFTDDRIDALFTELSAISAEPDNVIPFPAGKLANNPAA
ncbi:MAG TPA: hypothetical protein VHB72_01940 [Candidatus Saccharimonadales bacterium]|nr:hypothetical protein [Candidatus Saccharimonadales bacterium]